MHLLLGLFLGFSFLLPPVQLQDAFPQEYLIRHYNIEDGLPVNSVNGIAQDKDGYLYITTYDGLVRYDGYEFKVFNSGNTEGMETNRVGGLIKTADNSIWLFNEDGSLTRKSGSTFKTYQDPDIPGRANWIEEDSDGRLWVAATEGVAYFDQENERFVALRDPIFQTDNGLLGTGLDGSVYTVNSANGLVSWNDGESSILLHIADSPNLYSDIRQIRQFDENTLWLVGSELLIKIDLENQSTEVVELNGPEVVSFWNIHKSPSGNFILTANIGFYRLNPDKMTLKKLSIPVSSIRPRVHIIFEGNDGESIFIGDNEVIIDDNTVLEAPDIKFAFLDKEGSLWVGSETDGLYQIRKSSFTNLTEDEIPGLTNIYSIVQDADENIWTCSLNKGITRISGSTHQNWNSSNSILPVNGCKFLFEDSDNTLYAGFTDASIWMFSNDSWRKRPLSENPPFPSLSDPESMHRNGSQLLIGYKSSLMKFSDGEIQLFDESRPEVLRGVQVIRENSSGVMFTGSSGNGLGRIQGNQVTAYTADDGFLNSDIIRDIYLQSDDTLWVATENIGLNRLVLDESGKVISTASITTQNGLAHNSLHHIIEDSLGNIWLSSNGGIMRVPQKALNDFADGSLSQLPILHFDEKDGMINREANGGVQSAGILTNDQKLWFPNQRGVTIIDPQDFQDQQSFNTPNPVIESIELGDHDFPVQEDSILTIPDHQRDLRVNFTAPNFAYQDRIHFNYKLEGVNQNWQSADQSRQAVFTALPPGTHSLRIRAEYTNSQPQEAIMLFTIPARFYETGWFMGVLIIALSGLIFGGFKYRIRNLQARERKLQHLVDEQTKELQKAAEQKSRFFTGITHELKTPLSLIKGPLDDISEGLQEVNPRVLKNRISLMKRNSDRLDHLINQILDVSKLNADAIRFNLHPVNLARLTRQIIGQFQSLLEQEQISLSVQSEVIEEDVYVDTEAWERIIINLISNAIKFSPSQSSISIYVENGDDHILVSITDEGTGIPKEHQGKIFDYLYQVDGKKSAGGTGIGLFLVKGLMEQMGGSITLNSQEGKGSTFILKLKKGHSHFASVHTLSHDTISPEDLPEEKPVQSAILLKKEQEPKPDTDFTERILIVEDNHDFREYLRSVLDANYTIYTAVNGKEALTFLESKTPDLIISDVMMPAMNGLEFVHALRKKNQFKHLPVIFLSAKDQDIDVEEGLSTGADIYLTKPIRGRMLLSQVQAVLRRERVLKGQQFAPSEPPEPELLQQVREIIYRQLANPSLSVNMLADALFISRAKLYAEWKEVSDTTLNDFIKEIRFEEAKVLLAEKAFNVQETARAVGFTDANYFSTSFKKHFGVPPSQITQ